MKKWTFVIILFLFIVFFQSLYIYHKASEPIKDAQALAIEDTMKSLKLHEIIDVSFFNGDEAFQVVHALDEKDEEIFVWIPEKKPEEVVIEKAENGISKEQVKQYALAELDIKKIQNIRLGMKHNIPVWEITFIDSSNRYSFYYLHFNGKTWLENYRLKAI